MLYHASPTEGITTLLPHISNHDKPLVYLSSKRENVLVYLSNAVEKHCRETGFAWNGPWYKWASYGFDNQGILVLEEYYPHALEETYRSVSGYLYSAEKSQSAEPMKDIPHAYSSSQPVAVDGCEFIPDAYEALLKAEQDGQIVIRRYAELTPNTLRWLERMIPQEYAKAAVHPDYQHFLRSKFAFLK